MLIRNARWNVGRRLQEERNGRKGASKEKKSSLFKRSPQVDSETKIHVQRVDLVGSF